MPSKSRSLYIKSGIKIILISCILIAIDQIAKILVAQNLKGHDPIVLIDGVFEFYYLENPWAAFSLGKSLNEFFLILVLILTVIFSACFIYISFRIPNEKKFRIIQIIIILFLAGAIGNFIDRITHHYVIDFLYFVLINFPIFNIADIYVVFAAILFVCSVLFCGNLYEELFPSRKKAKEDAAADADASRKEEDP